MKRLITMTIMVLSVAVVMAQAPEKFTYQAVVRNASNQLVTNAPVGVRVSILQGNANGNALYVETQTATTNANGLMTVEIGGGNIHTGDFASIDWADGPYFLKTETAPDGGSDYSVTSTQQLLSVPYALYANEAGNVPQNVSELTNDANYVTLEQVPAQVNADWEATAGAAEILNKPTIPIVPADVSAFNNDAEYITIAAVPTQVSAFENDALYITEGELQQTVNVINNTFDSVDNVMNDMDNTIDSLRNRIEELEGTHNPPTVMTTGAADVSYRAAVVNGSIVHVGASPVTARGFCYDTIMHPTVDGNVVNCGSGSGDFSTNLLNLAPNTTYFVRAYATNIWGTNYGNELTFTTLEEHIPSVEISPATDISYTSFSCGGEVTDPGTYAVTARGICWATTPEPVMTGDHLHLGNGIGSFSASLTNLQPETTYYLRAYAVNATGVAYSTPITVTTLTPTIPTVTTDSVSGYNECVGTVLADGNAPVTQRGFCYDTLPNPTLENGVILAGDGMGEFTATISGLPIGKMYFVRAFASNAKGTAYGNQIHFLAGCDTKTLTDYDGNTYNTVTIGTQCWMKENLRTTHYSDGWPIELGPGYSLSSNTAYYWYVKNDTSTMETYGLFYNFTSVKRDESPSTAQPSGMQGICPNGWHVPSPAEWNAMLDYVRSQMEYRCNGSETNIAKALASDNGWNETTATCAVGNEQSLNNETGFSAVPAGYRTTSYVNDTFGSDALFWTSNINGNSNDVGIYINSNAFNVTTRQCSLSYGLSVRCLRDY